jgi:undecaprenyl-diphosphatase
MMAFFSAVTGFIALHPHFAYAAVCLLALSESIPIVGAAVPGSAVILAISALVPSGAVKLWPLLIAAMVGAIIGDGLSFWLGHRYHREILGSWSLNRQAKSLPTRIFFKEMQLIVLGVTLLSLEPPIGPDFP